MAIDLQKLEQKFDALFNDPNFVTDFEKWLEARNVSQNRSKPIVSGELPLDDLLHFAEYCGEHFVKMHGGWMPRFADQRNIDNLLTTEQVYARWRQ